MGSQRNRIFRLKCHISRSQGRSGVLSPSLKRWDSKKLQLFQVFNEPDLESQSNINAPCTASLWKQYINPLASSGIQLGGPAVTNGPGLRPWLANFLSACSGCEIDFIPLHGSVLQSQTPLISLVF